MKTYLAVATILAGAIALPAQAAYISIHDDRTNTQISVGQFEAGFVANGNLLSSGYGSGSLTVTDGTTLNFTGQWITYGTVNSSFDIYVVGAPGDTTAIGHLFGSVTSDGYYYNTITGTYLSGGVYSIMGGTTVVAGNAADFSLAYDGNTLTVDAIPEPAMLGLFGLGALGLGLSRRRKA